LQPSPARSDQPVEKVTLIPMGATRLRISAFPTIGTGIGSHEWVEPVMPEASPDKAASSVSAGGEAGTFDDGLIPSSND
jgi:hypothetical protein